MEINYNFSIVRVIKEGGYFIIFILNRECFCIREKILWNEFDVLICVFFESQSCVVEIYFDYVIKVNIQYFIMICRVFNMGFIMLKKYDLNLYNILILY